MNSKPIELWNVYIYLRKSRKDEERLDEPIEVTLARHQDILNRTAKSMNLNIVKVYKEVMTGDSIAARPMMLELLADIEDGIVDAVLVVDIDRLGRGDLQDQGYILNLFKRKQVKIITPEKIYDLDDEADEDMFDFKAFFARKELVTIKRRFARGKKASLNAGNYIGSVSPYGYRKKNKTLLIVEEEAEIVRLMFDLHVNKRYGNGRIATYLTQRGIKTPTGDHIWERTTIARILNNPIYIGKIAWNKRKFVYRDGKKVGSTMKPIEEWDIFDGKHPAIIDEKTFWKAQEITKSMINPHLYVKNLSNPLSYLCKCSGCGRTMSQRTAKNKTPTLRCSRHCGAVMSTYISIVEERLLSQLHETLQDLQWKYQGADPRSQIDDDILSLQQAIDSCRRELKKLMNKRQRQYDLLEEGVYTSEEFLERSRIIADDIRRQNNLISESEQKISVMKEKLSQSEQILPRITTAIEFIDRVYWELDPQHKNEFLLGIVDHVVYDKPKGSEPLDFKLEIYLRL